jgi:hypothetical protein
VILHLYRLVLYFGTASHGMFGAVGAQFERHARRERRLIGVLDDRLESSVLMFLVGVPA